MSKKLTTEEFINQSNAKHGVGTYDYSSSIYKGHAIKIKIICPKHGIFEQRPYSHWSGAGCDKCDDERASLQYRKDITEIRNNLLKVDKVLLSGYKNNKTKIKVFCSKCKQEIEGWYTNFMKGVCSGCSKEKIKLHYDNQRKRFFEKCKKIAHNKKFELLSSEYISAKHKLKWKCEFGHTWDACYDLIKRGTGCPTCYNNSNIRGSSQRLSHKYVETEAKKIGLLLLDKYTNCGDKLTWKCEKGHIWKSNWDCISRNGNCCFFCYIERNKLLKDDRSGLCLIGKNELEYFTPYIINIFKNYKVYPQFEVPKEKGWPYFVDFVMPELNLAVEYDEKGHFFQKSKDKRRQTYIENKTGLTFIRIKDEDFMTTKKSDILENLIKNNKKIASFAKSF